MHTVQPRHGLTLVRCTGDLGLEELARITAVCARARAERQLVVVDVTRVTHLHYSGARLLRQVEGLRLAGASRYVRNLVHAGGAGGFVELFADVEEALRAA